MVSFARRLEIEVDISLLSESVSPALEQIIEWGASSQVDNEPENISGTLRCWVNKSVIELDSISPGKQWECSA
ncbi:MAG: hypothetical protein DYH15_11380 [Nitrosomonas sp. PRO4]|nr:hypothetical protein [Nitrosomonas sp. PRO4]